MANTGDKVVATAWAVDVQNTQGTVNSTTYTATITGGTACGVAFVAPPSGQVGIFYSLEMNGAGTDTCLSGVEVRTGGVVGSGTVVGTTLLGTATDDLSTFTKDDERYCVHHVVSGLTPGNTYNARGLCRVTAGSHFFGRKHLAVVPLI